MINHKYAFANNGMLPITKLRRTLRLHNMAAARISLSARFIRDVLIYVFGHSIKIYFRLVNKIFSLQFTVSLSMIAPLRMCAEMMRQEIIYYSIQCTNEPKASI